MTDRPYKYHFNCTNVFDGESIQEMVDIECEITWETLLKHVSIEEVNSLFPFYKDCPGLTLKNDYGVQFCKSKYIGKPCYFIRHSAIEYIFLKEEDRA